MTDRSRFAAAKADLLALRQELSQRLSNVKDRRRAEDVRLLHEVACMLDPLNAFASQAGQDRVVDRLLNGKRNGRFVDIGAYDGVTGSNTLFFERMRGWTGILLEPTVEFREKAELQRCNPCLPFAIATEEGAAAFLSVTSGYTQMSGLIDHYDPDMMTRVRQNQHHQEETITVETRQLSGLLKEHGLKDVDYISLDIEGGEMAVLAQFPFEDHQISVWSIENNVGTAEIGRIMRANGYQLVEYCGPDEVYALNSLL